MEANKLNWVCFFLMLSLAIYVALVAAEKTSMMLQEQRDIKDALIQNIR